MKQQIRVYGFDLEDLKEEIDIGKKLGFKLIKIRNSRFFENGYLTAIMIKNTIND
jgi:hypothetical protein